MRQAEEFVPCLGVFAECSPQRRSDRLGILFLHSTHHHAEVVGFDHHTDSRRSENPAKPFRDLLREALLHLEALRVHVDDSRSRSRKDSAACCARRESVW